MAKSKKTQKSGPPESAIKADFLATEAVASVPATAEAPALAGGLSLEEAFEAARQPEAAPTDPAPAPLKEEKESARETVPAPETPAGKTRKTGKPPAEAPKPVNRIEREGADFRLFIAGEKRGSYAFYATASHAFEEAVGRPPVKGEYPNGDRKPETPPAVVNGCRIRAAVDGNGFDVFFDGKFRGWKKDLGEAETYLARLKTEAAAKLTAALAPPPAAAVPSEVPVQAEKSPKPAKTESKTVDPVPGPGAISPELAAHCAETVRQAGIEAETERVRQSLLTLKALAADVGAGNAEALAALLAAVPEDLFRAEAERRGLLKAAAKRTGVDRRDPALKAEHAELTRKAWVRARELAKEKGGAPQSHMKEAWAGLVRD